MIKVVVCTYTSERDVYGNCYHFARFYNTAKSRHESIVMEVGSASNALHIAYELADDDYESLLEFTTLLPKRQWQQARKVAMTSNRVSGLYEGSHEANAALKDLFPK